MFSVFVYLVLVYRKIETYQNRLFLYKDVLTNELRRSEMKLDELFNKGVNISNLDERTHFYNDLNIFGNNGLYTYLDTTLTRNGHTQFVNNLLRANLENSRTILERQKLIQELSSHPYFGLKLLRLFGEFYLLLPDSSRLGFSAFYDKNFKFFQDKQFLRYSFKPLVGVAWLSIIAHFLFDLPSFSSSFFFVQMILFLFYRKEILSTFKSFEGIFTKTETLQKILLCLYSTGIKSPLIAPYFESTNKKEIKLILNKLDSIMVRASLMRAPLPHFLANVLFLWDLWNIVIFEKWNQKYSYKLKRLIESMELVDSVLPFVIFQWHNPSYTYPVFKDDFHSIIAENMGHPLIPKQSRISNPIEEMKIGEIAIITGSNMSGKTTYLRTIGINCLLAMCGAPVPADKFLLPPVEILSSIRNQDSLREGISLFYAEVKKISFILKQASVPGKKYIILLDEILKGTNTRERLIASKAILEKLQEFPSFNFITTHDIELTKDKRDNYVFWHFTESISDGVMNFDYVIKKGVVKSSNALKILELEGIEITTKKT